MSHPPTLDAPGAAHAAPKGIPLVIDLQDGFADDTVAISVEGQEILNRDQVTTNYAIGRADSVQTDVAPGPIRVEIRIPTRHLTDQITLDLSTATYLGVSLAGDKISVRISGEMFLYF